MADLLAKVKLRLQGNHVSDAQNSPDSVAEEPSLNFHELLLFGLTQVIQPVRLPQLELDRSEFATQVLGSVTQKQPESQSGEYLQAPDSLHIAVAPNSPSISAPTLQDEIARASLTDEENDLAPDTTRDLSVQKIVATKGELQQIEQEISLAKRLRNIQPVFEGRKTDPIRKLVAAFDDSDSEPEPVRENPPKLSPVTLPIAESDSDFDTADILATVSKPRHRKNPIDVYAHDLRKTLGLKLQVALDDLDDEFQFEKQNNVVIPGLSKDMQLAIKKKYSRRKYEKSKDHRARSKFHMPRRSDQGERLLRELLAANSKQLHELKQDNPDAELLEEIEKEEEEMGNLLEREMERVRRIRKKEKMAEKRRLAEMDDDENDADYASDGADADSAQNAAPGAGEEVPDSEVDSDSEGSASADEAPARARRDRHAVLSESELENLSADDVDEHKEARADDSYMFGGGAVSEPEMSDDDVMRIQSDFQKSDSPSADDILPEPITSRPRLFSSVGATQKLPLPSENTETQATVLTSTQVTERSEISTVMERTLQDATVDDDNINDTIRDSTFADTLQDDESSELRAISSRRTQKDDDLENIHDALQRGREHIAKNIAPIVEEDEEEDEEQLKKELAFFEAKIRRKELRARQRRKKFELNGLKNILEGEAEESDDEWKGIGGMDNEDSDQANSEDERMIDNALNLDLNDDEVRDKFMEQYRIKDRKDLEKLMDDVKNHRLVKRARGNRFDIELSDEEDQLLIAYRKQKLQQQKQRLAENQKLMQMAKSEKAKPFFEALQDDSQTIQIETDEGSDESDRDSEEQKTSQGTDTDEPAPVKRVLKLKEAFVQKQLLFLQKNDEDDYFEIQRMADNLHAFDEDNDIEDMAALKQASMSNLYRSCSPELVSDSEKRSHENITDEDDDELHRVFKRPSMVSLFRSFRENQDVQVTAKLFSGVTVNKEYKMASGSKASITFMSKNSKSGKTTVIKSSRTRQIEESVNQARNERSMLFGLDDSFT